MLLIDSPYLPSVTAEFARLSNPTLLCTLQATSEGVLSYVSNNVAL